MPRELLAFLHEHSAEALKLGVFAELHQVVASRGAAFRQVAQRQRRKYGGRH